MYFALAHIMSAFCYLKYGLAGILSFVGFKMIVVYWDIHIDVLVSLAVIVSILAVAIVASLIKNRRTGTCAVVEKVQSETCPALKELNGSGTDGEACPALKDLRETEEKYHK
jgi:tellurite resistance protein TerC